PTTPTASATAGRARRNALGTAVPRANRGPATLSNRTCCAIWAARLRSAAGCSPTSANSATAPPAHSATRRRSTTGTDEQDVAPFQEDQHEVRGAEDHAQQPQEPPRP